jgi:exodeoxyribonuclease V alpha subunit
VLTRLGAARSAWNAADVRGGVEQLLARAGMVADPAVRRELAEDLTARALADCVPLLAREVPAHLRSLSSPQVLDVEADLTGRLAVRGTEPTRPGDVVEVRDDRLDEGQLEAVAVLAGPAALAVVEGAAGAGKTTMLAETRRQLTVQGHRLIVVTPTLKAAQAASAELGAQAGSAAWLAHQHGWRWDDTGAWTRLRPGDADPATGRVYAGPIAVAALAPGDLLLVDEAGMLDQDSARALLMIADETGARLAVVGDRHQLPAVGRGGVLDLAVRWADLQTCATLDAVHRFTRRVDVDVPDRDYAALTLAMRTGEDPDIVFDRLHSRGQVRIQADDDARRTVIADEAAADHVLGRSVAVVVDTREQAADLNTATRDRLIAAGRVDDTTTASTATGQRIGAGDTIATRRNDYTLAVANRDTWTVTEVHREGRLTVTSPSHGRRDLPAGYVREHVELAYATTAHGVQGDTTDTAHVVLTDRTGAAAAYVGMTRGRHANAVYLVAADLDDAREQWTAAFGRDRADLGPEHAAALAAREAAGYRPAAAPRRPDDAARVADVLDELRFAWTEQHHAHFELQQLQAQLERVQAEADRYQHAQAVFGPLREQMHTTRTVAEDAAARSAASRPALTARADAITAALRQAWDADLPIADAAARTVQAGTGRLGLHRGRVRDARDTLDAWAEQWRPVLDIRSPLSGIAHRPAASPARSPAVSDAITKIRSTARR